MGGQVGTVPQVRVYKASHSSRWNWRGQGSWVDGLWVEEEKFPGPYGVIAHILSSGVKIAYLYWLRYEYTQATSWLRERAYPMLKRVAEFYRNYPNFRKG